MITVSITPRQAEELSVTQSDYMREHGVTIGGGKISIPDAGTAREIAYGIRSDYGGGYGLENVGRDKRTMLSLADKITAAAGATMSTPIRPAPKFAGATGNWRKVLAKDLKPGDVVDFDRLGTRTVESVEPEGDKILVRYDKGETRLYRPDTNLIVL